MTEEQRRAYAEYLILNQIEDLEYLSIFEAADVNPDWADISDEDAKAVSSLIDSADITIEFPEETS